MRVLHSFFMLQVIAVVAIAELVGSAQQQPTGQQLDSTVIVSYSLLNKHPTLHEPIILNFKITNRTSYPAKLDLGVDRKEGFSFTVTNPSGARIILPVLTHNGLSEIGTISVKPGHSYAQKILLNEWYAFPTPGKYEIEGHLIPPIMIGQGVGEQVDQGFHIGIEIGPRNEDALTKLCDDLTKKIDASTYDYRNAADATLTLSYVDDPVAVPYLRRALFGNKLIQPIAIDGLERIGDLSSVEVLGEAVESKDIDMVSMARSALTLIRQRTSDSQVREEISRILANH